MWRSFMEVRVNQQDWSIKSPSFTTLIPLFSAKVASSRQSTKGVFLSSSYLFESTCQSWKTHLYHGQFLHSYFNIALKYGITTCSFCFKCRNSPYFFQESSRKKYSVAEIPNYGVNNYPFPHTKKKNKINRF